MKQSELFLNEFLQEAASTRKILALVPFDQSDYKPHPKSMSLKALAIHIAGIAGWWKDCLVKDVLDFSVGDFKPKEINNTEELLAYFDGLVSSSETILKEVDEANFDNPWTMRNGEQIYFTLPKGNVTRTWCLNHWYHHRGQLTVYLRLLDIPLVGMYGPTADDNNM